MSFDAHANFAYSSVATAPSPALSGTSLTLHAGDGALLPAAPFNMTVWPTGALPLATNAEIVRVTNVSTDTLTIVRAQESTSARAILVGDQIAITITAKTLKDVENSIAAANPSASLGLSVVNGSAATFMRSDAAPALDVTIAPTMTGQWTFSKNAAASTPPVSLTGTWFTSGGTSTTTKPQLLVEPAGTSSAAWSTAGTGLGVNAPSGFTGDLINCQVGGSAKFRLTPTSLTTPDLTAGNIQANAAMFSGSITSLNNDATFTLQNKSFTGTNPAISAATGTWTNSSGTGVAVNVAPTFSTTQTGGWIALKVNATQTSDTGSGTKLLQDWQLGGGSQANINSNGDFTNFTLINTNNIRPNGNNASFGIQQRSFSSANSAVVMSSGAVTNSSGQFNAVAITPTYNQSSTAAATDFVVNRTETAIGSGTHLFEDFQIGGNSIFNVGRGGGISTYGSNHSFAGLATPTGLTVTPQGTTGSTTYGYRVAAVNAQGTTLACTEVTTTTGNATLTGTNKNHLVWNAVNGATSYKVYGRTAGSELLMNTVTGTGAATYSYDDTLADTPSGALPGNPAGTTLTLQAWQSQTGNVLAINNSAGTNLFKIDQVGTITTSASIHAGTGYYGVFLSAGTNTTLNINGNNYTIAGTSLEIIGGQGGSITNSSGTFKAVVIDPTYNQTSTAAATDFTINRTETAVGSGAQLLCDMQVGGASKFNVSNVAVMQMANATAPSGTPSSSGYLYVESGALKYKGSSGTITVLGAA